MTIVDRLRYDGKRALVVGGATGMGAAAAKSAAELGAEVIVLDYAPVNYDVAQSVQVDLRDPASIDAALEQIEGPIHALFSAAGVADGTTDLLKINFIGHRHLIDRLLEKNQLPNGSAICFISSVAGMGWENDLELITEFLATPDFAAAEAWSKAHEAEGIIHYGTSKKIINQLRGHPGLPPAEEGHSHQRDLPGPDRHPAGPGQCGPVAQLRPGLPGRDRLQGPHPGADGRRHGVPQQRCRLRHQRDHAAGGLRAHDGVGDRRVRARQAPHRPDHGEGQALTHARVPSGRMARVIVIGGHGKVALQLARILTERGDEVSSVFRNPDHSDEVAATGAKPVVADIEQLDTDALADLLAGHDAVVFSAGAGGGNPARTYAVDRDAAIRVIDAAAQAGVRRFVMVSYFGAGPDHGVPQDDPFFAYAEAKAAADAHLRASDLDWTVLGPGRLTLDPPTGRIARRRGQG